MDDQEKWFIDELANPTAADADIESSIHVLEVLLSLDALPALLRLITGSNRPLAIKQQAAEAISKIGPKHVLPELTLLRNSGSSELRRLAELALEPK